MEYLEERGIGFDVGITKVPLVCESCLFDLMVGDFKTRPDKAMDMRRVRARRRIIIRMETSALEQVRPSESWGQVSA